MATILRGSGVQIVKDFKAPGQPVIKTGTTGVLTTQAGHVNEPRVRFPGHPHDITIDRDYIRQVA